MADNFDLRQFLTENKLTKNAKLLNEAVTLDGKPVDINSIEIDGIDTSDYPDFVDAYITYAEYQDGTPLTDEELMSLEDQNYGIVGELIFDKQLYTEGEEVEEGIHDRNILSRPLSNPAIEPLEQSPEELGRAADARSENILRATYNRQIQDPNISNEELKFILTGKGVKGFGGTPNAVNNILASRSTIEEFSPYGSMAFSGEKRKENEKAPLSSLEVGDLIYAQGVSGDNIVVKDKKEDGTVGIGHPHSDRVSYHNGDKEVQVVKRANVKENKMTQRDKYLTRLVENALGIQPSDDDEIEFNPADAADEEDYRRDQYLGNQMEEGDEMVQEKPLPKYENIEKLMQEIDKSTDEAADKHKMQEMKRVADMLEKKCTALEEGDDADHIDQKKLKQMKKDIMTLRKGIEKMEKLAEKKFAKKEQKAELKEGFDLRKFLVENKLTRNSRMLNESELNELDANVQKLRDAFLAKLTAINKSQEELFNDDLFNVDKGARDLTKKYFMDKEKINNSWKELHNYVKGTTPPQLSGKPGAPPMPNLPPKPGAPTSGKPSPPPLPPGARPAMPPLPPGVKPSLKTPPPINRNLGAPTSGKPSPPPLPPGVKPRVSSPPIIRNLGAPTSGKPPLKTPPPINRKPTQR